MWTPILLAVVAALSLLGWWWLRPKPLFKLTLREGDQGGLDFVITDPMISIGSGTEETVMVSHPKVATHHAVIHFEEEQFVLHDRSTSGVRVNGEVVTQASLRSGDLIRLGDAVDLIFTRLR